MNLLHFILFVLLGFLTSSAAAFPRQMIDVATGNIGQDVDRTAGMELAARQGYPSSLLQQYELKCALDRKKTPFAPGVEGSYLSNAYCQTWFVCQSDGTKKATGKVPSTNYQSYDDVNQVWCEDWCECVVVDKPEMHGFYQYGCISPAGKSIPGNFGSVSRDTHSTPVDDGLAMEAFEGPPRKD